MKPVFTEKTIEKISNVLCADWKFYKNHYRIPVIDTETNRKLTIEIYPDIPIGDLTGNLINVYAENSHLQLQFCTGYIVSKMLGEVTFISECQNKVCGLIIEREAACSLYANVDSSVLSGDFTKLGPEVMMSGIALSLTEHILPTE